MKIFLINVLICFSFSFFFTLIEVKSTLPKLTKNKKQNLKNPRETSMNPDVMMMHRLPWKNPFPKKTPTKKQIMVRKEKQSRLMMCRPPATIMMHPRKKTIKKNQGKNEAWKEEKKTRNEDVSSSVPKNSCSKKRKGKANLGKNKKHR